VSPFRIAMNIIYIYTLAVLNTSWHTLLSELYIIHIQQACDNNLSIRYNFHGLGWRLVIYAV